MGLTKPCNGYGPWAFIRGLGCRKAGVESLVSDGAPISRRSFIVCLPGEILASAGPATRVDFRRGGSKRDGVAGRRAAVETFALPVREPVLMQGAGKGIWVADGASQTLNCFHPDNGRTVGLISLPGEPVGLGAAGKMLVVSLASGAIIAFDEESGQKLWNDAVGSAAWVKGSARLIWVAEKNGGPLIAFDRSGRVTTVPADGLTLFAANDNGVVWISRGGVLVWSPLDGTTPLSVPLPSAPMAGEMVHCASAIWASVPDGLLLIDHVSLQVRSVIAAPEGPARHILCVDGKLAFGTQTVYVLNPMADAGVRVLGVRPGSPLRGLAATPSKIWALESATPLVHIADFY